MEKVVKISESQLRSVIREVLNEVILSEAKYTPIRGYASYCPGERDLGFEWDDNTSSELDGLMYTDYRLTFTASLCEYRGDYYQPSEEYLEGIKLVDDSGIKDVIMRIKRINPELGSVVERDFSNYINDAFDERAVIDGVVEWDFNNPDYSDYD